MSENYTSVFNPDSFMETEVNVALETKRNPLPDAEYQATITDVAKPKIIEGKGERGDQLLMEVTVEVQTPDLQETHGFTSTKRRIGLWLDVNEHGGLASGPGK